MDKFYYNPLSGDIINPVRSLVRTGVMMTEDRLKELGYLPLIDALPCNQEYAKGYFTKDAIVVQHDVAIQTYKLNDEVFDAVYATKVNLMNIRNAVDDAAAELAGVQLGEFYNNNGEVRIRMV